ncbi:MAG: leucine-rich repeat domain-containing protein [Lachnospiraceae bacterium]|nr:leucine-rich repeat domain-containing protein [Lachnospiraceae bacterium]
MKKCRLLLLLVALTLVIGALPSVKARAVNEEFTTDDGLVYKVQGYYSTPVYDVCGYTGKNTKVVIPEYVDNETYGRRPVMRIEKGAFKDNTTIKSVSIPASVTSIEREAFMGCTSLTKATLEGDNHQWALDNINKSGTYLAIGDKAFADCTKLTDFEISYGIDVTSGEDIFAGSGLKHLKFVPCGWTQNTPDVFNNCSELESVDFYCNVFEPGSSKRLGLDGMTGLPKLKEINVYGFTGNTSLGIDYYSKSTQKQIKKEDAPALEYINIYFSSEDIRQTFTGFGNSKSVSSDPEVVEADGSTCRIKGEGVAEVSCDEAPFKLRIYVGQSESSKKKLSDGTAVVPQEKITYTGETITPYAIVTYDGEVLKEGTDYQVGFKDNKDIGAAKAVFTGVGDYEGELTATFSIIPPTESYLTKAVISGKKAVLSWSKGKNADAYQVYYSTKKAKGYKKLYSGKDTSLETKTVKSGMYIKIRTYKKVGKTTYYSEWTAPVQVK